MTVQFYGRFFFILRRIGIVFSFQFMIDRLDDLKTISCSNYLAYKLLH